MKMDEIFALDIKQPTINQQMKHPH